MTIKDALKVIRKMTKIQNRINENDKKPKAFGTNQLLYQSEIHFIEGIGCKHGVNASQLSKKLGITNGAVTQVSDKLLKKKLIEKYKKATNKKEVYLKLTESGKIAYESHRLFHKELSDKIIKSLDALSKEQMDGLLDVIDVVETYLPRL